MLLHDDLRWEQDILNCLWPHPTPAGINMLGECLVSQVSTANYGMGPTWAEVWAFEEEEELPS